MPVAKSRDARRNLKSKERGKSEEARGKKEKVRKVSCKTRGKMGKEER